MLRSQSHLSSNTVELLCVLGWNAGVINVSPNLLNKELVFKKKEIALILFVVLGRQNIWAV